MKEKETKSKAELERELAIKKVNEVQALCRDIEGRGHAYHIRGIKTREFYDGKWHNIIATYEFNAVDIKAEVSPNFPDWISHASHDWKPEAGEAVRRSSIFFYGLNILEVIEITPTGRIVTTINEEEVW